MAAGASYAAAMACEPTVVIGTRVCDQAPTDGATSADPDAMVDVPWSTGFEDGFCDYASPKGFCYATGSGAYGLVTSPVHSGRYAAAFSVSSDAGSQVRCVEQGVFPKAAYYGVWYYVPETATNSGLWNLVHFQAPPLPTPGVWDLELVNLSDGGGLHVSFFDFLTSTFPDVSAVPPIPIGRWFHFEVYFKRASDATGELALWQDGVLAMDLTGLATDNSTWGQWYVGNLATALSPPASTVYVDDVTIGASR